MPAVALIIAFWPVLLWYFERTLDRSDPSWGLLALVACFWVCLSGNSREGRREVDYTYPSLTLLAYLGIFHVTPPMIRAALGVVTVVLVVSQLRFGRLIHGGVLALGLLALPVLASLQFYAGFPLRVMVTRAAAALLEMNGLRVMADGAALRWGSRTVLVDAPCSGVGMLWVALFFASLIVCLEGLQGRAAVLFFGVTLGATIGVNVLRATALFYLEAGILKGPIWLHKGVGLAGFLVLLGGLAWKARSVPKSSLPERSLKSRGRKAFLGLCALAAVLPLYGGPPVRAEVDDFKSWPETFEGRTLKPLPLSASEKQFYSANFPGRLARFTDGNREILIRWVTEPTRTLHPSSDCFRGLGFEVDPPEVEGQWRTFRVTRNLQCYQIKEKIVDQNGKFWTDVSSWYWDALLGRGQGPYWSFTVARRSSRR